MPAIDLGTALSHGLSIYTAGNSAVSAYGPVIGRDVAVVALMVPGSASTETSFAVTGAAVGDAVIVGPPSALSASIDWNAYVSSAGNITLRLSGSEGTSTSRTTQTAQTWAFTILRRSFITSIR